MRYSICLLGLQALLCACPSAPPDAATSASSAAGAAGSVAPVAAGQALRASAAPAARPAEVAIAAPARCRGACTARAVPLAPHVALATWVEEQATSVQLIDTSARVPLGPAVSLGQLAGGDAGAEPHVFPLANGDVAFAGVLANGRITLAIASEVPARRIEPKVVCASEEPPVRGLAVALRGGVLTLLVLRSKGSDRPHETMQVQLQSLDAHGEPLGPRQQWSSPPGYWPRMADCGGAFFLAWASAREVLVTRLGSGGAANTTTSFASLPHAQGHLAPLACTADGVRVLTAWGTYPEKAAAARSISFATVTRDGQEARGKWSTVRLPGRIQEGSDFAFIDPARDVARVAIHHGDAIQSVTVDLATAKLATSPAPVALPSFASCVPTGGEQIFCADTLRKVVNQECHELESTLAYSFPGAPATATGPATMPAAREYFAAAPKPIADADTPPPSVLADRASRSFCGEPGWDGVQSALAAWCRDPAGAKARFDAASEDELGDFDIFCGTEPHSVLFQTTNCTDQPLACKPNADRRANVDRQQLASGRELWLPVENCTVSFARTPGAWHVTEAVCESAE